MKVKFVRYGNLHSDEHFQYMTEMRDLVAAEGAEALKIKPQFQQFLARYDEEDTALKKIAKSSATAAIEAADHARDLTFNGLAGTCKAALNHYDRPVAEAAARLQVVFGAYGNLAAKSLNEETSGIYNLLQDLNGKYAADVQTAGLAGWVAKLGADNNALEALVKERNDENASKTHLKLKECRSETDKSYSAIIERVNALIVVDGEAAYAVFANKLNEFTDKYNNAIAQRHGRAKARNHHAQPQQEGTQNV
jgi:hypothetical protein